MKKGELGMEEVAKLLIVIVVLLVVLYITWLFKDKMLNLLGNLAKILRFR